MGVGQGLVQLCLGVINRRNRQCRHRHVFVRGAGNPLAPVRRRGGVGRCRLELHRYIHFYMETSLRTACQASELDRELINRQNESRDFSLIKPASGG